MDFQQIRDFVNPAVAQATGLQEVENLSMPVPVAYVPVQLVIDGALSLTSENPVQNKVIAVAIQQLDGRITAIEGQFSEGVTEAVNNWLAAHPEATTTVQDGAISYAKLDANLKGKADDVDELKSALTIIGDDLYNETERTDLTTVSGWRLNESDGLCSSNASYKLLKYTVVAGNILKIISDDRFQFQTVASVPTFGTSNKVGATYGAGTYFVKVPSTATYLIISTPTTSNAHVYACDSLKGVVAEISEEKMKKAATVTKQELTMEAGYYTSNGAFTASSSFKALHTSVTPGSRLVVDCSGGTWTWPWMFFDNNNNLIKKSDNTENVTYLGLELIVPNGATWIAINGGATLVPSISTLTFDDYTGTDIKNDIIAIDNDIASIINAENLKRQYIDNSKAETGYYYSAAGIISTTSVSGYAIIPKFSLPAGTYYYRRIASGFSYVVDSGGTSSQPFENVPVGTDYNTVTFATDVDVYITELEASEEYVAMICDGTPPSQYVYGLYKASGGSQSTNPYIIVDANGQGDFTSIQDAIDSITNDSASNQRVIIIMPGKYGRIDLKGISRRYISLIGVDDMNCIIEDDTAKYENCAANIWTNGIIKNLTFRNTIENHTVDGAQVYSYAVHNDFGASVTFYENCHFYSEAGPAVGMGISDGSDIRFVNCEFVLNQVDPNIGASSLGALFCHSGWNTSGTEELTLINCQCINKSNTAGAYLTYTGQASWQRSAILINNVFWGTSGANLTVNADASWDYKWSYGNNVTLS